MNTLLYNTIKASLKIFQSLKVFTKDTLKDQEMYRMTVIS